MDTDPKARVVEIIKQWAYDVWSRAWSPEGNDLTDLADRLDQAGLLAKGWVSVKERLPEAYESVLVYFCEDWNAGKPKKIGWAFFNSDGKFAHTNGIHQTVTHWQPLPQPPQGD